MNLIETTEYKIFINKDFVSSATMYFSDESECGFKVVVSMANGDKLTLSNLQALETANYYRLITNKSYHNILKEKGWTVESFENSYCK